MKRVFSSSCCRCKVKFQKEMNKFDKGKTSIDSCLGLSFCFSFLHQLGYLEHI